MVATRPTTIATIASVAAAIPSRNQRSDGVKVTMMVARATAIAANGAATARAKRAPPFGSNGDMSNETMIATTAVMARAIAGATIRGRARRRWTPIATPPQIAPTRNPEPIATQPDEGDLPSNDQPMAEARYRMASNPAATAPVVAIPANHRAGRFAAAAGIVAPPLISV